MTDPLAPFDWTNAGHVVVRAGEAVDWNFADPSSFIKRVQSIEYGLSAETEFAAILSWLGRCALVHRLDQDCFAQRPKGNWCIPDLLAIFDHGGARVPVLIEVKTRKQEFLALRTSDLDGMQQYATDLSLPLLIAWKPRALGFWLLVDPIHFKKKDGKSILSLDASLKNDLLGTVAGDFLVVAKENAGLFFEANIIKKLHTTNEGFDVIAQITNCRFRDANGTPVDNLSEAMYALLFSCIETVDEVTDSEIRKSFVTRDHLIHAQDILRTAVAIRTKGIEPIRWRHVAKDMERFLSRDTLDSEIQKHFGSFVKYQYFQHPEVWPEFLPPTWNAIS